MNRFTLCCSALVLFAPLAAAQADAVFPDDYVAVAEGPFNSPNLPLAKGTSRVMCLYDVVDLAIPSGDQITRLGFREDGSISSVDQGVTMQLEVRMGWSTRDHQSMSTTFDSNYDSTPVTVFGPSLLTLPALRDPSAPLADGKLYIDLTTPFSYVPAGRNLIVEYRVYGTAGGGSSFNYRLDRADYYSPVTQGPAGCPHSGGGVPVMSANPTRPGLNWVGTITNGPANAPAFAAINIGLPLAAPYPLTGVFGGIDPSCTGQMALTATELVGGATSGSGSASWSFQIPNDNVFADMIISSQTIFLDFFAPGQVVASNGVEVKLGVRNRSSIVSANGAPSLQTTGSKSTYYCPVAFFTHQ